MITAAAAGRSRFSWGWPVLGVHHNGMLHQFVWTRNGYEYAGDLRGNDIDLRVPLPPALTCHQLLDIMITLDSSPAKGKVIECPTTKTTRSNSTV